MSGHIVLIATVCFASLCAPAEIRVWDGDTMWVGERKFRMTGYDTPERGHRASCSREAAKAEEARERLAEMLGTAGRVDIGETVGRSYDRELAAVSVDGRPVGDLLIAQGLATERGTKGRAWCR